MKLLSLLALGLCACQFPVGPREPDPEPTPDGGSPCEKACARFEQWGCKEADEVCEAFDASGKCALTISCTEACQQTPHAYPDPACVIETEPGDAAGACELVRETCE